MKIVINIEADSAEEAKAAITGLFTHTANLTAVHTYVPASENSDPVQSQEPEPKKRASRKTVETPPTPTEPEQPKEEEEEEAPTQSADDDLLGAPAAVVPVEAPKEEKVDYEKLRATISAISDHTTRQQIKDLVGQYKKADGTACEKVPDLQVTDYGSFYAGLQKITKVV